VKQSRKNIEVVTSDENIFAARKKKCKENHEFGIFKKQ